MVVKEFHRLMRRIDRVTDGQASLGEINWDNGLLEEFEVVIRPNGGYYKGGTFKFCINIPDTYPSEEQPFVWCDTPIYHPNIDPTDSRSGGSSNVCLNILSSDWSPAVGLEGMVLGLIYLLYNPNFTDALSPVFDYNDDEEDFAEKVRQSLAGGEVDGFYYEANIQEEMRCENGGETQNGDGDADENKHTVTDSDETEGSMHGTSGTNNPVDEEEKATRTLEQANGTDDRVHDEEGALRELMSKGCTLEDDSDEDGGATVGLIVMYGESVLVTEATNSGVCALNGMVEQDVVENVNEDSAHIRTDEGVTENSGAQSAEADIANEATGSTDISVIEGSTQQKEHMIVSDMEDCTLSEGCSEKSITLLDWADIVVGNEPELVLCANEDETRNAQIRQDIVNERESVDKHVATFLDENRQLPNDKNDVDKQGVMEMNGFHYNTADEHKQETNKVATKFRDYVTFFTTMMCACVSGKQISCASSSRSCPTLSER